MASLTIDQAFQIAVRQYQAGQLPDAKILFQEILSYDAGHADAHYFLGIIHLQEGSCEAAAQFVQRAIDLRPSHPGYHVALGQIRKQSDRPEEATTAFSRATKLDPQYGDAWAGLGSVFLSQKKFVDAIAAYRKAIANKKEQQKRQAASWHTDLGAALAMSDQLDEALVELNIALQLDPEHIDAHLNVGLVLLRSGRLDEAAQAARRAIELRPTSAAAHNNLGVALTRQNRHDQAIASLRKSIELNPHQSNSYMNLAQVLTTIGQTDEAIRTCEEGIRKWSDAACLYGALGNALRDAGQLDASLAAYDRAIELDPLDARIHSGRIFARHFHAGSDWHTQAADMRLWDQRHALPLAGSRSHENEPAPDRRLRVGYISPDFTNHVLAFTLLPLFESHDRSQVETYFYSDVAHPTALTRRFQDAAHHWTSIVGCSDSQVAEMIRNDRIDILVNLTSHMRDNRLLVFARKPAPVQVTWAAYPGPTGLSAIGYRLTDPYLELPPSGEEFHCEQPIKLPETFWCYDPLIEGPPVNELPALKNGFITFGCLNNIYKVNSAIVDLWSRVLRSMPRSRMLVLCPAGCDGAWLRAAFEKGGIPADRIELVTPRPRPDYLELYQRIDICLDTLPYNGHTTSLDSLWMGVPVITLVGSTIPGRAGLSQLTNLDLTELVADDEASYIELACTIGSNLPALVELRANLRQRMKRSPLTDKHRFAQNVEAAYREMWRRPSRQRAPNP